MYRTSYSIASNVARLYWVHQNMHLTKTKVRFSFIIIFIVFISSALFGKTHTNTYAIHTYIHIYMENPSDRSPPQHSISRETNIIVICMLRARRFSFVIWFPVFHVALYGSIIPFSVYLSMHEWHGLIRSSPLLCNPAKKKKVFCRITAVKTKQEEAKKNKNQCRVFFFFFMLNFPFVQFSLAIATVFKRSTYPIFFYFEPNKIRVETIYCI